MRERLDRLLARLARFERRELRELRRWLARTSNLLHLAVRLAGSTGQVTVGTCIGTDRERRRAERTLADLVGTFEGNIETRVSRATVEEFLTRYGPAYDLVILGASRDRSAASRFVSRPTFERIDGDEGGTDIAILDRR